MQRAPWEVAVRVLHGWGRSRCFVRARCPSTKISLPIPGVDSALLSSPEVAAPQCKVLILARSWAGLAPAPGVA